jgi:hypothetical protein
MRLWLGLAILLSVQAQDVHGILRSYSDHNRDHLRDHTYQQRVEVRTLNRKGAVQSSSVRAIQVQLEDGRRTVRVFDENNAPVLDEKELKYRTVPSWRAVYEPECPGGKQLEKFSGLELLGADQLEGRSVWIISGSTQRGKVQDRTKLWVDQQDFECARFEEEIVLQQRGAFGGNIFTRSMVTLEQTRTPGGIWLPSEVTMDLESRVLSLFRHNQWQAVFTNFQQVRSDSEILRAEQP